MAIYRIIEDSSNYDSVVALEDEVSYDDFDQFDGRPLSATWRPIPVSIYDMNSPADIYRFAAATPAMLGRTWDILSPSLRNVAEALPLRNTSSSIPLLALNVFAVIDCLDHARAVIERFPTGKPMYPLERYAFMDDIANRYPVFRIPETRRSEIFATEAFRELVLRAGLKGLIFKQLL